MNSRAIRPLELGFLLPALLGCFFCLDVFSRLLPAAWFTFRPQEALGRFPVGDGPYFPGRTLFMPATYGDLANLGNLPAYREYHSQTASSDAFGYRNPPELVRNGNVEVFLLGDSFSLGTSLNDEETISAYLNRVGFTRVYNMAGQDEIRPLPQVLEMARRLRSPGGIVIYQHLERKSTPAAESLLCLPVAHAGPFPRMRRLLRLVARDLRYYSPVKIICQRLQRALQNDRIFPNPYREHVVVRRLRNGRPMLFPAADVNGDAPRSTDTSGLIRFAAALRPHGFCLVVLLVPNKYTVYGPLLAQQPTAAPVSHLTDIQESLERAGITVVNPLPALQQAAHEALAHGRLVYWQDDTHWNAEGSRLAARLLAEKLEAPLARARLENSKGPEGTPSGPLSVPQVSSLSRQSPQTSQ